jgi:hypothetical protein
MSVFEGAGAARAISIGAVAVFALGALAAWPVLRSEQRSAAYEASAMADLGGPPPLPWESLDAGAACGKDCPARAQAAMGVKLAHAAALARTPQARADGAEAAKAELGRAVEAVPSAGEWWAWLAYARLLHGDLIEPIVDDLQRSYDRAPYLERLAPWRITTSAELWPRLTPRLRGQVADETVWLRDVDPEDARAVLAAIEDPAARETLARALAERPPAPSVPHRGGRGPGSVGFVR